MKAIAEPKFSRTSQRMKRLVTRLVGPLSVATVVVSGPAAGPAVIGRPVAAARVMRSASPAVRSSSVFMVGLLCQLWMSVAGWWEGVSVGGAGLASVQAAPPVAESVRRGLRFAVAGEDALLVAFHTVDAVGGGEVGEV